MNVKYNDSIQYVIACITTHSYWLEKIASNCGELKRYFELSDADYLIVKRLLSEQAERLVINARIMEEKRFREVVQAMRYTAESQSKIIKLAWLQYLEKIPLTVTIPQTPADEAISFLNYLMGSNALSPLQREIALYEYHKNMALSFRAKEVENVGFCESDWYVQFNPSMTYAIFDFNIAQVLNKIHLGQTREECFSEISLNSENYIVLFCKSRDTGSVSTMKLAAKMKDFLSQLKPVAAFADFKHTMASSLKISEDGVRALLLKMRQHDIISFALGGL